MFILFLKAFATCALLGALLGGCTNMRPSESYVPPNIAASDAAKLATDTTAWLVEALPPAHTTVIIDPPTYNPQDDVLTPAIMQSLREAGYGVIELEENALSLPNGVVVRYLVSPITDGLILRLQYKNIEAARIYARGDDGALGSTAPFTVRSAQ
jgi:hypothetical protein